MRKLAELDPAKFFVLPLGVGDAFTRRFFHSSILLIAGGRVVLVDCPAPFRRILGDASRTAGVDLDVADISDIVLTHLHGDHCNGLEEFGYFSYYALERPPSNLYLLPENHQPLWENRLMAAMGDVLKPEKDDNGKRTLSAFFDVVEWDEGRTHRLASDDRFTFDIIRTRHSVPCFGFRARFGDATIGYSGDGGWDEKRIEFLAGCDMIIHETGVSDNHTPIERLLGLPNAIKDKMYLIHAPDELHDQEVPIKLLEEGKLYSV